METKEKALELCLKACAFDQALSLFTELEAGNCEFCLQFSLPSKESIDSKANKRERRPASTPQPVMSDFQPGRRVIIHPDTVAYRPNPQFTQKIDARTMENKGKKL